CARSSVSWSPRLRPKDSRWIREPAVCDKSRVDPRLLWEESLALEVRCTPGGGSCRLRRCRTRGAECVVFLVSWQVRFQHPRIGVLPECRRKTPPSISCRREQRGRDLRLS